MTLEGELFSAQTMVFHNFISLLLALSKTPSPSLSSSLTYTSFRILCMPHWTYKTFMGSQSSLMSSSPNLYSIFLFCIQWFALHSHLAQGANFKIKEQRVEDWLHSMFKNLRMIVIRWGHGKWHQFGRTKECMASSSYFSVLQIW